MNFELSENPVSQAPLASQELTANDLAMILGITVRGLRKKVFKERWRYRLVDNPKGGGHMMLFKVHQLPGDVQKIVAATMEMSAVQAQALCPEAQRIADQKLLPVAQSFSSGALQKAPPNHSGMSADTLKDPQVKKYAPVIILARNVPRDWNKTAWVEAVARNHEMSPSALRVMMNRFGDGDGDYEALRHIKPYRGEPRKWDPRALDYSAGLILKRGHRKWSVKSLFDEVLVQAFKQGWKTGGLRSWQEQVEKRLNTKLRAIRDGGVRALDNLLPPTLRDNSDLPPLGIVVGDQHRCDRWVRDDHTLKVFRPEFYLWQDLRTRILYGGAIGVRYDKFMVGLGLWIGNRRFGALRQIYTDNGRPERSGYVADILSDMATLGMSQADESDGFIDASEADAEELCCVGLEAGRHRKGIVKNAKCKMSERTNSVFEAIQRDVFRLPGDTKRLTDSGEEQEVDHDEAKRLAKDGKLLTFSEYRIKFYETLDYYNNIRPHAGVLKEWKWDPRPQQATPMDCLIMCYHREGWRPVRFSEEALNLIFLPKKERKIDRGRIHFHTELAEIYEHPALVAFDNGELVTVRYNPLDPEWLLVFGRNGKFVCQAHPVEYSSMKDSSLAQRKIKQKTAWRQKYLADYRRLTDPIPDLREFSTVPLIESQAAAVRAARKEVEDLRNGVEVIVDVPANAELPDVFSGEGEKGQPARRTIFENEVDKYIYLVDLLKEGEVISIEDEDFIKDFEADESRRPYVDLIGREQKETAAQGGQE